MRAAILFPLLTIFVTGCVEFAGDRGVLGFASNLKVGGVHPWTPDDAVLDRTQATFRATDRLDQDGEQSPQVRAHARRLEVVSTDAQSITIRGEGRRGMVRYHGEVSDRFRVTFRPAHAAVLLDPYRAYFDLDAEVPERFGIVDAYAVMPDVRDARGRSLGLDVTQASVTTDRHVIRYSSEGLILSHASPGTTTLNIGDLAFTGPEVVAVAPGNVESLTIERHAVVDEAGENGWLVRAVGYTRDGLPVLGLDTTWTWDGRGDVLDGGWILVSDLRTLQGTWQHLSIGPAQA